MDNNIKKKFTFQKMFFLFLIFSFIGCLYEDIYFLIKNYFRYNTFNLVTKRGLLYFELSPIYGIGACLMIYVFSKRKNKKFDYFWLGALIGGVFEYFASLFQEVFIGTISWDYSTYFLNINGRTTIPYMLFWGLLCYLMMTKIYPYIEKKVDKLILKMNKKVYYILVFILFFDALLSISACARMNFRNKGMKHLTFYGEFLDKYYNDERIKESYTNMRIRKD